MGLQLFRQRLISKLERAEVDWRSVAAGVTGFQGIADLVPAHVRAIQFVLVTHGTHIGVRKVGLPQTPPTIQHGQCLRR